MTGFRIRVQSDDLARIMGNALAFFPARSPVKTAELRFYVDHIYATGTDTYTVGRDRCDAFDFQSAATVPLPVSVELDREGWQAIEKMARRDRGMPGALEYRPGDCLIFHPGGEGTAKSPAESVAAKDQTGKLTTRLGNGDAVRDIWALSWELLERLERSEPHPPERMTFDPAYFGRFQKVKVPREADIEPVLDLIWQGDAEPTLAKIGPTFLGAIMPIDRAAYVKGQGDRSDEFLF